MSCMGHIGLVSNVNCDSNTINVYNSAYAYIDMDTKHQICSLVRPACDILTLRMPNIQRQPNSFDCGVFAIATATELALGKDPRLCYWDTTRMRIHLIQCLEQGKMESFPQKEHRRIPLGNQCKKTMSIKIFCICRMPNDTSKAMVKCDSCQKWMHKECWVSIRLHQLKLFGIAVCVSSFCSSCVYVAFCHSCTCKIVLCSYYACIMFTVN